MVVFCKSLLAGASLAALVSSLVVSPVQAGESGTTEMTLTVDKNGTIFLNGEAMRDAAAVAERLQALQGHTPLAASATAPPPPAAAEGSPPSAPPSILWSDTYVSARNLWQDRQPGYPGNVQEHAVNISYTDGWTYGTNFISLDLENFTHQDGSNSVSAPVTAGSAEFYGVFRTVFSGNKISGSKDFSFGPVADLGWEVGLDLDTQNDQFASFKKLVVFGPQVAWAMPKGFWVTGLHLSHEWDTDAYLPNGNGTNYDLVPEFETAWLYPFTLASVPLSFSGYANIILPKGKGATGDFAHRTEILAHPKLMVDIGSLIGTQPGKIEGGIGYEYWLNKFGDYNKAVGGGTQQNAWFVELGYHWH